MRSKARFNSATAWPRIKPVRKLTTGSIVRLLTQGFEHALKARLVPGFFAWQTGYHQPERPRPHLRLRLFRLQAVGGVGFGRPPSLKQIGLKGRCGKVSEDTQLADPSNSARPSAKVGFLFRPRPDALSLWSLSFLHCTVMLKTHGSLRLCNTLSDVGMSLHKWGASVLISSPGPSVFWCAGFWETHNGLLLAHAAIAGGVLPLGLTRGFGTCATPISLFRL